MKSPITCVSQSSRCEGREAFAAQPSDEDLMCAIQRREPLALNALFQRHRALLLNVILRIVHDRTAADDVIQECFSEIWFRAGRYSVAKGKALSWIVTLARRRAIDQVRRYMAYHDARNRMKNDVGSQDDAQLQNAEADVDRADMESVLRQFLGRLPRHQEQVINLAFLKGMSQREVARATHTPLGTVKTRIELGLKKLRTAFRTRSPAPFQRQTSPREVC